MRKLILCSYDMGCVNTDEKKYGRVHFHHGIVVLFTIKEKFDILRNTLNRFLDENINTTFMSVW